MDNTQTSTQWYFDLTPELRIELTQKYYPKKNVINLDEIESIWIQEEGICEDWKLKALKAEQEQFNIEGRDCFIMFLIIALVACIGFYQLIKELVHLGQNI